MAAKKTAAKKAPAKKTAAEEKADNVIAPKRKRLEDLYVFGTEKEIQGPDGGYDKVWVQKLSPAEEKQALKPARAVRSRISIVKRKPHDDPDFLDYVYLLEDYGLTERDELVALVMQDRLEEMRASIELKVAGEDKWSEDDYLLGLQEAWVEEGLRERFIEDPEDEEAVKVLNELQKFTDEVLEEFEPERKALMSEMDHLSEDELREKAAVSLIEREANHEMMEEFRLQRILLSVREVDNHDQRYFSSIDVVRNLPAEVKEPLEDALEDVTVGVMEGKD